MEPDTEKEQEIQQWPLKQNKESNKNALFVKSQGQKDFQKDYGNVQEKSVIKNSLQTHIIYNEYEKIRQKSFNWKKP